MERKWGLWWRLGGGSGVFKGGEQVTRQGLQGFGGTGRASRVCEETFRDWRGLVGSRGGLGGIQEFLVGLGDLVRST